MGFPKYNKSNKTGRKGVRVLHSIIEDELNWQFRINHQEDDFGIDAYIDIISKKGELTGKSIAVQIKSGKSYFETKTDLGWRYYGKNKHLNYYLNHEIPVLLIIVDVDLEKAYWTLCDAEQTKNKKMDGQ